MRVDPALRALAADPAPQHAAQKVVQDALAAWRRKRARAAVFEQLGRHGAGAPLGECRELASLFASTARARAFVRSLLDAFLPVLAAQPLARMPFRPSAQGAGASLLLGRHGRASLVLAIRGPGTAAPEAVAFADGERHDAVLAGRGRGVLVRAPDGAGAGGPFVSREVPLRPGARLSFDMAQETLVTPEVRRALVSLRLTRAAECPRPSREYRWPGGALIGQASGDPRASRHELMLAVLGRTGRAEAAPILAEMTREGAEHLRWQALRECLALDAAAGYRALVAIARAPDDPLARPAGALRAQLLESHPQLAKLEARPCPA